MCGICGLINYDSSKIGIIEKMADIMAHRGPDGRGTVYLEQNSVAFGHRRLSIIDLSENAKQPLSNEDGTIWVTYNGEIYNFNEIKALLIEKGHRFKSHSDTEVIVHSYEEWGIECIHKFVGMFAFGLWDGRNKKLFLVRDRMGKKPIYYLFHKNMLAFASEIKSLLMIPGIEKTVSAGNLLNYQLFLWAQDSVTPFEHIFKLPPAHYLVFEKDKFEVKQYWDINSGIANMPIEEYENRLLSVLDDSVRLRLISDVSLGAFLSGGVDSSLIIALMKKHIKDSIITYTVGFGKEQLKYDICSDDIYYSRKIKDFFKGLDYNEIMLEPDVVKLWPKIVWHLDEPIGDPAALSTYLICKSAKEKATVMLSGMGGEELFGGYPRHLAMKYSEHYRLIPEFLRKNVIQPTVNTFPASKPGKFMTAFRNINKFVKSADLPFDSRYLGYFSYYSAEEMKKLAGGRGEEAYSKIHEFFESKYFNAYPVKNSLESILYVDQKTFLPCLNLTYTDKASMAASVEVRTPLLDHRIAEMVAAFPSDIKIKGNKQKYILKKIAEKFLPKEIVWRKKAGFGGPVRAWVKNAKVKEMINDLLSEKNIKNRGLFDYKAVKTMLDDNSSGKEDNALNIWQLLTTEIWFRTFVDGNGEKAIS